MSDRSLSGALVSTEAAACAARLAETRADNDRGQLPPGQIRLLSWNVQKGQDSDWVTDLADLAPQADLLLLQEATAGMNHWSTDSGRFRAFAPGYRSSRVQSGLITVSATAPLTQCNLTSMEPLLGTPKTTMITQYAIADSGQTLAVVNIHAINFTLGVRHFKAQLAQLQAALAGHRGPMIVAGDFNTWHAGRTRLVAELIEQLGLKAPVFEQDQRKRFLGFPLDHLYLRGLRAAALSTAEVDSSDHNPITAVLEL